jgi:hypothetical protein
MWSGWHRQPVLLRPSATQRGSIKEKSGAGGKLADGWSRLDEGQPFHVKRSRWIRGILRAGKEGNFIEERCIAGGNRKGESGDDEKDEL